ncbi:hypothetical protein [Massilia sp. TWP1-3-3]|uniref:hypothetical protein n=1 Tax=Massilia sp. TWP1-3-3 TaxID=2804573 RepID=UPI003CED8EC8
MTRENNFRTDQNTAEHIAEALKLQAQYSFDYAKRHVMSLGAASQLALRMLAIGYQRRARTSATGTRGSA